MKKNDRRIHAVTAILLRCAAGLLAVWLFTMSYLTVAVAQDLQEQWRRHVYDSCVVDDFPYPEAEYASAYQSCEMIERIHGFDYDSGWVWADLPLYEDPSTDWNYFLHPGNTYDAAVVILDRDNQVLHDMGDHITCYYITEASWLAGNEMDCGYTYVDLGDVPGDTLPQLSDTPHGETFPTWPDTNEITRLTGYFEGDAFHLVKLATVTCPDNIEYGGSEMYEMSRLDLEGKLQWQIVYDKTDEVSVETVNIYSSSARYFSYTPAINKSIHVDGEVYPDLNALAEAIVKNYVCYDQLPELKESLWDSCFCAIGWFYQDAEENPCYYALVLRCLPMQSAMQRLFWVYLTTLLLFSLLLLPLWLSLRRKLQNPMKRIEGLYQDNLAPVSIADEPDWLEPYLLEQGYDQMQQKLHTLEQENTQLRTALDYARDAEENRRTLVSNITHELKTPLAVIHSYAEGLIEGIAVDKQGEYLDIILEETRKMDAMVLKMLDLSRLEAGKAKFATENFSLLEVTQGVVEKLRLLIEEKNLTVEFAVAEDFLITGDEGRIAQVVTNLVSNAVKYTPEGGTIQIKIYRHRFQNWFTIENTCPPLPEEALDKVFDSFYRVDTSRSTKGTGLGLAIVKAIVSLHNGTCGVRNTETGVEFSVILP